MMMIRENIKEKFYDCHIHIPMQSINPVETLLKEINDNDVDGFVLILNSSCNCSISDERTFSYCSFGSFGVFKRA